jgi:hypothetical protein
MPGNTHTAFSTEFHRPVLSKIQIAIAIHNLLLFAGAARGDLTARMALVKVFP